MPWQFSGETARLSVRPGEMKLVNYRVFNPTNRTMIGQAVPSVSPGRRRLLEESGVFLLQPSGVAGGGEQADAAQVLCRPRFARQHKHHHALLFTL